MFLDILERSKQDVISMLCYAANLNKVPHGGWFALAIAGAVFGLSYLWWWGTNTKHRGIVATQVTACTLSKPCLNQLACHLVYMLHMICKVTRQRLLPVTIPRIALHADVPLQLHT